MYLNRNTRHILSLIFAALLVFLLIILSMPVSASTENAPEAQAKTESKCFSAGCFDARHYYTQNEAIQLDPNKMLDKNPSAAGRYQEAQKGCFTQHCFNLPKE